LAACIPIATSAPILCTAFPVGSLSTPAPKLKKVVLAVSARPVTLRKKKKSLNPKLSTTLKGADIGSTVLLLVNEKVLVVPICCESLWNFINVACSELRSTGPLKNKVNCFVLKFKL
jgi:hypothetical protein